MEGYFDRKHGNYLPFEPEPIGETADGYDYYPGDTLYQLEGTDEWYMEQDNLIERIKNELIVTKEAE